jgi:hypothetical protein
VVGGEGGGGKGEEVGGGCDDGRALVDLDNHGRRVACQEQNLNTRPVYVCGMSVLGRGLHDLNSNIIVAQGMEKPC